MKRQPVTFYSEAASWAGKVNYLKNLRPAKKAPAMDLGKANTAVKDCTRPATPRFRTGAATIARRSDTKGWGASAGPRTRLAPYSRVADVQAALTFFGTLPEVDAEHLGIYGTSYGGATVVWVGAVDARVKCIVSVVGIGHGARWMRSVRRPDEWHDLLERSRADRVKRALDGQSEFVDRTEILLLDRQSAGLAAAARRNIPAAVSTVPL